MPAIRTPLNFKVISGTQRKDREQLAVDADMQVLSELPPVPNWLPNQHAIDEWNRLGPVLISNKLLTAGGSSAFAMLCALHGALVQIWLDGDTPTGHMLAQWRALVNDFCLTPAFQGKLKPVAKETENPFERNGKPARRVS